MSSNLMQKLKLRKLIKKLKSYRGRHTEFISVYVPPNFELVRMINQLQDEQGTATNIKDKNTSKAVISALERMIRTMRTFDKTPKNGLAIFSGNISDKENVNNIQVFWVEPTEPLNLKLYRCNQRFITKPLEEMDANETTYGLIVVDKGEATVGVLVGSTIKVLKSLTSTVPGKTRAGGQSAQRFERIRAGAAVEFYKRVAYVAIQEFTFNKKLKGIIVGGPGTSKNNFIDGRYMNEEIKKKIIGVKDITYTNTSGLYELFDKSQELLADDEVMTERLALQEFFKTLATASNMVVYGLDRTKSALNMSAINKLIVIDTCVSDNDLEELNELCEQAKTEFILVTDKTPEGMQYKGLTGVGGILRFPIES